MPTTPSSDRRRLTVNTNTAADYSGGESGSGAESSNPSNPGWSDSGWAGGSDARPSTSSSDDVRDDHVQPDDRLATPRHVSFSPSSMGMQRRVVPSRLSVSTGSNGGNGSGGAGGSASGSGNNSGTGSGNNGGNGNSNTGSGVGSSNMINIGSSSGIARSLNLVLDSHPHALPPPMSAPPAYPYEAGDYLIDVTASPGALTSPASGSFLGGMLNSASTGISGPGVNTAGHRARRKSLSTAPLLLPETDDDTDHGTATKKKQRRARAGSFSYLPFHRRKRASGSTSGGGSAGAGHGSWLNWLWWWWYLRTPTRIRKRITVPIFLALLGLFGVYIFGRGYEVQFEYSIYSNKWVRDEVDLIQPLKGCFDPHHISADYNLTAHREPRNHLLSPGIALRRGLACYDFAATIQDDGDEPTHELLYHTYWRSDLMAFGPRQVSTLSAFLATQPLTHSRMVLWSNGADVIRNNEHLRPLLEDWAGTIEVRQVDMTALTRGTELEGLISGADGAGLYDRRAWVDGDAVRLLVLWHYGGLWMDMDQILTRDLHPLTESEFVTQWDCYDKPYFQLNGAIMHFRKHSPYLCEAFHIMASSPLPKPNTFTWGSHLYSKLHRRLLAARVQPFAVLPWCFSDPRNCRSDVRFPDPFKGDPGYWAGRRWDGHGEVGRSGRELLEEKLGSVWSVHLHNQWTKGFPKGGWMERLLEGYKEDVRKMVVGGKSG